MKRAGAASAASFFFFSPGGGGREWQNEDLSVVFEDSILGYPRQSRLLQQGLVYVTVTSPTPVWRLETNTGPLLFLNLLSKISEFLPSSFPPCFLFLKNVFLLM